MTRKEVEAAAQRFVEEALTKRASELSRLGLAASSRVIPRGSGSAELHIAFSREGELFTFVEDFIVRGDEPVTPMDELKQWIWDSIDDVLNEAEQGR